MRFMGAAKTGASAPAIARNSRFGPSFWLDAVKSATRALGFAIKHPVLLASVLFLLFAFSKNANAQHVNGVSPPDGISTSVLGPLTLAFMQGSN